jgi:hypothetical protein
VVLPSGIRILYDKEFHSDTPCRIAICFIAKILLLRFSK